MDRSALTPMMRQYYELKDQVPDCILLFRMGDFFEIFGEDAQQVAPVLGIVLTSRERGDKNRIPFCGVPHHSAQNYWARLIKAGYRVAIADQMEEASQAKGLVKREIVRVLTPGCLDEGLESDASNYLMGVYQDPKTRVWALVLADISTGELRLGKANDLSGVRSVVDVHRPKEILVREFQRDQFEKLFASFQDPLLLSCLPEKVLQDTKKQQEIFEKQFPSIGLEGHACGVVEGGLALISSLLCHYEQIKSSTVQFLGVRPLVEADTFTLGENVIRDLELFVTSRQQKKKGSLLKI